MSSSFFFFLFKSFNCFDYYRKPPNPEYKSPSPYGLGPTSESWLPRQEEIHPKQEEKLTNLYGYKMRMQSKTMANQPKPNATKERKANNKVPLKMANKSPCMNRHN